MYNPCQRKDVINMAKTKPVGSPTTEKGGTMTAEVALTQLMLDYNRYQEYKKDNDQRYNFVSKQQMSAFAKRLREDDIKELIESYEYQRLIQKRLANYLYTEKVLNNVYGREDVNFMELSKEERDYINKRRARQAKKQSELV